MGRIKIGTWHEKEVRKVTRHTSYAADHIEMETHPGDYDLCVSFKDGYKTPMPDWLLVKLDATVIGGGYYSGFGGVNYGFTPADLGPTIDNIQAYVYQLPDFIKAGKVTLEPKWAWLAKDTPWREPEAPTTWKELEEMTE